MSNYRMFWITEVLDTGDFTLHAYNTQYALQLFSIIYVTILLINNQSRTIYSHILVDSLKYLSFLTACDYN